MLLRSQIRCLRCQDLIASISRHDFRYCKCGQTAIDGGRDYLRVAGGPYTPAAISIREDLPLAEAGRCLAVLRAVAQIAPADKPRSAKPLTLVNNMVRINIWESRARPGLPKDIKVSRMETKKWLDLLAANHLVKRYTTGNNGNYRHTYRALVELAAHPEVDN